MQCSEPRYYLCGLLADNACHTSRWQRGAGRQLHVENIRWLRRLTEDAASWLKASNLRCHSCSLCWPLAVQIYNMRTGSLAKASYDEVPVHYPQSNYMFRMTRKSYYSVVSNTACSLSDLYVSISCEPIEFGSGKAATGQQFIHLHRHIHTHLYMLGQSFLQYL